MADAPPKATFGALEDSICSAIETLDRIDEFCLPSELPDNQGLGVNMCAGILSATALGARQRLRMHIARCGRQHAARSAAPRLPPVPAVSTLCGASVHVRARTPVPTSFTSVSVCWCALVSSNDLVRKLGVIKDAGARVRDDVPGELVHEFIDEGRTPDEFSAQLHGRVTGLRDGVHAKADLLRRLEEQCLATCGDLADPEAVQPATADAAADGPPNR